MEQAPFAPANARYYLMAILSIEHDLSQKLDLEAVYVAMLSLMITTLCYFISYAPIAIGS